ncbi:hypothetical protein ILYODFUR_035821 [Ilyodon furcidens]|uniref:Uncharacterized protein n=1 Tax=Ilyodon furcidens TaxID=33524 RepID=A0ABV0TPM5_9TELE
MEPSYETSQSPESGCSGSKSEKKILGKMEVELGLEEEAVLSGGEDLGVLKESMMIDRQVTSEEVEVDLTLDDRKCLQLGGSATSGETEMKQEPKSPADLKMDEEEETRSSGDEDVPASDVLFNSLNPEDEELMKEEEHRRSKEEEEVSMDTGESEEMIYRC